MEYLSQLTLQEHRSTEEATDGIFFYFSTDQDLDTSIGDEGWSWMGLRSTSQQCRRSETPWSSKQEEAT